MLGHGNINKEKRRPQKGGARKKWGSKAMFKEVQQLGWVHKDRRIVWQLFGGCSAGGAKVVKRRRKAESQQNIASSKMSIDYTKL